MAPAAPTNGEGARVVTHLLASGGTLSLEWTPDREGNWLFHCHIMSHVSPARRLGAFPSPTHTPHGAQHDHSVPQPSLGMAGMVMGIAVLPSDHDATASGAAGPLRQVTMVIGAGRRSMDDSSTPVDNGAPRMAVSSRRSALES